MLARPAFSSASSSLPPVSSRLMRAVGMYEEERFSEALELFIDFMRQAEAEHDDKSYIVCTGYIGNIYSTFGDYNSCVFYLLKGYRAAVKAREKDLQTSFLANIVSTYCRLGMLQEAHRYYKISMRTPPEKDLLKWRYFLFYNRGRILQAEHRYDEAVCAFQKALGYVKEHRMPLVYELFQLSEIGNLYVQTGKVKEAIDIGGRCVSLSEDIGNGELLANAWKMLADAHERNGNLDSARHYRTQYFVLNDSLCNTKKFFNARNKLTQYENELNLRMVTSLKTRIGRQMYVIFTAVLFLILLAVFVWIIVRKNRYLAATQRMLIDKNKEMERRDQQNRVLLEQYIRQMKEKTKGKGEEKEAGTDVRGASQLSGDEEKALLNRINAVMADEEVISNPAFSLQMLSEMVQSNTKYVSRAINSGYRKTFKVLLNEYRIRAVCQMLTDTDRYERYTLQAIYETCGYTNAATFFRAFKKVYGMTPTEYCKLVGKQKEKSDGERYVEQE